MPEDVLPLGAWVLEAAAVATPAGIVTEGWVVVDGPRVLATGAGRPPERPRQRVDGLVAPGFVDVHGGPGSRHLTLGTTTSVACLAVDTLAGLAASCARLADAAEAGEVAGIHLEGPWLSPRWVGAQAMPLLAAPRLDAVALLLDAARGQLRMVTLAPELPGALAAIEALVAAGVVVALGHTDATYDETRAALAAGASVGTGLFDAMAPLHHLEPGPVAALLESAAYVELVGDAKHLHPSVLGLAWREGRTALVGDHGLDASLRFAVSEAGIPLVEALRAVTATPAAMVGLERVGRLDLGSWADLVVLSEGLEVRRVMRRGEWVTPS